MFRLIYEKKIEAGGDSLAHFGSTFFVVQVKGSKRVTHSQSNELGIGMQDALAKFKTLFPGLDWDYMNIREYGELICDVGITIHPAEPDEPLVGLWRLDYLEASYGAGGYLTGRLHTINTLPMYGGLQAESSAIQTMHSHISFRSSYSLPYEAIRQHDNSQNLFSEKSVYN